MAFPDSIDSFLTHTEILAADVPYVERFQVLKLKSNRTPDEENEMASLLTRLRSKFISSEDFNKFQEALVNMQVFIRDNVVGYINTMKTEVDTAKDQALIAIEQKKNGVIDYLDGTEAGKMRNDIGVMADLTTTAKSSLVNAINEVNAKAPQDGSTTQKGIVQLSSIAGVSEELAATPKLVKDSTDAISTTLSTHTNTTTAVHGSTNAATANRIVQRDSAGRAKIATPSAADDIARLDTITGITGALSSLSTSTKTNLVSAINEVFNSGVSAKQAVVDAINAKGGSASTSDTWAQLAAKIQAIQTSAYQRITTSYNPGMTSYPSGTTFVDVASFPKGTAVISANNGYSFRIAANSSAASVSLVLRDVDGAVWVIADTGAGNSIAFNSLMSDLNAGWANYFIQTDANNAKSSSAPNGFSLAGVYKLQFRVTVSAASSNATNVCNNVVFISS